MCISRCAEIIAGKLLEEELTIVRGMTMAEAPQPGEEAPTMELPLIAQATIEAMQVAIQPAQVTIEAHELLTAMERLGDATAAAANAVQALHATQVDANENTPIGPE